MFKNGKKDTLIDDELHNEIDQGTEDGTVDEGVDEAFDPANAHTQAIASVLAAAKVGPGQKLRKGDKSNAQASELPKTKAGMINAGYQALSKLTKEELQVKLADILGESSDESEVEVAESTFDEDLKALVESEATLSESFKEKAEVIFEAALKSKLVEHVQRLEESYAEELAEETATIQKDLVEKIDGYLNYVIENWMEENKVAIENGLRTEIAESFMSALHGVFTEHYITVPESKVDLVDELTTYTSDLEEQLNASVQRGIELTEQVNALSREVIIRESATGLSESQAEKLKSLAEGVDYEGADSFIKKVSTIKESYFKKEAVHTVDEASTLNEGAADEVSVSPMMERYLAALKK